MDSEEAARNHNGSQQPSAGQTSSPAGEDFPTPQPPYRPKWTLGMLNDKETDEVPGTILLLTSSDHNEPLGLNNIPNRASSSSLPNSITSQTKRRESVPTVKRTPDGQIVLTPQPEDSVNDPLNWPQWRRDAALLSLGFYCMVGGGTTPLLAAGYDDVADQYNVTSSKVALTTGFYMLGLGIGSIIMSPTAILFGKRPVYCFSAIVYIVTAIWCAASPNYSSLLVARIFQGISVSPVECLPSATIAEIFFLHERAYRIGIYTLLMLGDLRMLAIAVGFSGTLVFFFVPETFWDRTPRPRHRKHHIHMHVSHLIHRRHSHHAPPADNGDEDAIQEEKPRRHRKDVHVGFVDPEENENNEKATTEQNEVVDDKGVSSAEPTTPA
ncbi:pantothenate synthase, partial [Ascosphaera pollenicola]